MSIDPTIDPAAPDPADPTLTPEDTTSYSGTDVQYIRHRDRMIRESVFEDLINTLIACRWMAGTTSRKVRNVDTGAWGIQTTGPNETLRLLTKAPLTVIEYFPETQANQDGPVQPGNVAINTFAMDVGRQGEIRDVEVGSPLQEQDHIFNMAFYAEEDAVALALLNDLRDRYTGRIVNGDGIALYNYLRDETTVVSRMEVESFRYARDADQVSAPEVHLFFCELVIQDLVS